MHTHTPTVLAVDDEPDLLNVICGALRLGGRFRVHGVRSGRAALQWAQNFRADLVLLDLMMPEMDGLATLDALRALPGFHRVPAVFLTARTEPERLHALQAAGALGTILKPFNAGDLGQQLLHLLYPEYTVWRRPDAVNDSDFA